MADVNPLDTVVTLLSTNYNEENTDNIKPVISIIYEKPFDKNPNPGEDFIFIYSELTSFLSAGLGNVSKVEVRETVKIDVRSRPSNASQNAKINDDHARKVLAEIYRILYSNLLNPDSNFTFIDPHIDITDLSDGLKGIFRYVIKINLVDYGRDMLTS